MQNTTLGVGADGEGTGIRNVLHVLCFNFVSNMLICTSKNSKNKSHMTG